MTVPRTWPRITGGGQSWELRRRTNSGEVRPTLAGPGPEPGAGVLLFCLRSPRLGASESSPQCGPCLERAGDQSSDSGQCLGHSSYLHGDAGLHCAACPGRGQPPQPPAASVITRPGQDQRTAEIARARGGALCPELSTGELILARLYRENVT